MVKNAETENMMAEEDICAFYEAQGQNLLEIQDVEIMDSETEQQAIERAYYNREAMVGTDETLDGFRPVDSATVDLTPNQPTANYGQKEEKCIVPNVVHIRITSMQKVKRLLRNLRRTRHGIFLRRQPNQC